MNCKTAKQINMVDFLIRLGYQPQKTNNNDIWFFSPFRCEKTPSFKINKIMGIWYDFGEGRGGTIIDFIMRLKQCNLKEALNYLESSSFSLTSQTLLKKIKVNIKLLKLKVSIMASLLII